MLMKDDKKQGSAIVQSDATAPQDELDYVVDEVMAAIERKDRAALKESLKALVHICMDQYEATEE